MGSCDLKSIQAPDTNRRPGDRAGQKVYAWRNTLETLMQEASSPVSAAGLRRLDDSLVTYPLKRKILCGSKMRGEVRWQTISSKKALIIDVVRLLPG
jgi:hypothetical protein